MEKHEMADAFKHQPDPSESGQSLGSPITAQYPSQIDEKVLVRKIDRRVLPVLFVIYVAAFLDRVNISNALTLKLPKDLHLVGNQPNIALTIFFVSYILFEIPSNILMKQLKPHLWMSGCILAFGIVMMCQGSVTSFSGLLTTRFFLGLAEAGIFPGSFYLLSSWYKREESQKRFTIYWCSVLTANMFGGLLASAISKMDGIRGMSSWRWIFILEGLVTIIIGIISYFLISDFPEDVHWLSEEERSFVIMRAGINRGDSQSITLRNVLWFFADVKHVLGGLMYFGPVIIPTYSFSYFAPTIVKTLGYSTVETQLHTVPPFAAAFALCLITAYFSDITRLRFPFIAFGVVLTVTGLGILMTVHHNFHTQYAALCLVAMGAFTTGPIVICWYVMNLHGDIERNIGTAWMIGFGNCGGLVATFTFLSTDAPLYHTGYSICMGGACLGALAAASYACLAVNENRKSRAHKEEDKDGMKYYSL